MKKIISILLAAVMLFTVVFNVPIVAVEVSEDEVIEEVPEESTDKELDGWSYVVEDGFAVITGYSGEETTVTIPDTLDEYSVNAIGVGAFRGNTVVTTVSVPAYIETMGEYAFAESTLKYITVHGKNIGTFAFSGCTALENVTVGKEVEEIATDAFEGCVSLSLINVEEDNAKYSHIDGVLFNKTVSELVIYPANKAGMIYFVPETVSVIGNNAFLNNVNLKSIVIKGNVQSLSDSFIGLELVTDVYTAKTGFVIFGYYETAAHTYANKNGIEFYDLNTNSAASYTYSVSDGSATITGYTGGYGYLSIPAVIDGYPVVRISSYAFQNRKDIYAVYMADSITTIREYAFSGCTNLQSVKLSKSLTTLYYYSFRNCTSLTEIEVPKSLTEGSSDGNSYGAFNGCNNIKTVSFEDGCTKIANGLFANCKGLETIVIPDTVTIIESYAFYYATALKSIVLSKELQSIGSLAFSNCSSLETVEMPNSVTLVGGNAFEYCTNLSKVTLSKSLESIGSRAFRDCDKITEIEIPKTLTSAGYYSYSRTHESGDYCYIYYGGAFDSCSGLKNVSFEPGITTIPSYLFLDCDGIEEIVTPDTVTTMGSYAFCGAENIKNITLSSNLTLISEYAFTNCISLENIDIPDSVTEIRTRAFHSCTALANLDMGDGVTTIREYAFNGCTNLQSVKLSKSLTTLWYYAFMDCTSLTEVEIPKSLTEGSYRDYSYDSYVRYGAFNGCNNLKTVSFEEGCTEIASGLFANCKNLETIVIPDTVTVIESYAFYNATTLKSIVLSEELQSISSCAFSHCSSLEVVEMYDNVTWVGSSAFEYCTNLSKVTLSKSLETIGDRAFWDCDKITEIVIPKTLTSAGYNYYSTYSDYNGLKYYYYVYYGGAFGSCSGLKNISFEPGITTIPSYLFLECDGIEEIVISDTVTTMGSYAFSCAENLKNITLSSNLTLIGEYAFTNCISLESIDIPDSVTEIRSNAFHNCTSLASAELSEELTTLYPFAFYGCSSLTEINIPKTLTKGARVSTNNYGYQYIDSSYAFAECSSLKTVVFEEGCTVINYGLLRGCKTIETIVLPNTVTTINEYAFSGATNLKSIIFSENLASIWDYAFYNCSSLESAIIPDSVTSMGTYVFRGCTSLAEVKLPNIRKNITQGVFYNCISLTRIELPETVITIASYAFYNCDNLTYISIPEGVNTISSYAFYDCDNLAEVTIGEGTTEIGTSAFYDCDLLKTVSFPSTINNIYDSAFRYCDVLENITFRNKFIANTGLVIGQYAFADCPAIKSINFPNGLTTIGAYAFLNDISLATVYLPPSVSSVDSTAISYPRKLTITGVAGSYAQTFAENRGCNFTEFVNIINGLYLKNGENEKATITTGDYFTPEFEFTTEIDGAEPTDIIILSSSNSRVTINNNRLYANSTGTTVITATATGGLTYQFEVEVVAVRSIAITEAPYRTEFSYGEELDLSGMVLTATFNNGTTGTTEKYTVSGYDSKLYGEQTINISFKGYSASLNVTVIDDRVYATAIELTSLPDKTVYIRGESLDFTGMVISAINTDGSVTAVRGYNITGFNKLKVGTQTLTVTYTDPTVQQVFSLTFDITVRAAAVSSVQIQTLPSKLYYYPYEQLNTSGLSLLVTYENDTFENITSGYELEYDFTTSGTKNVTITYGGQSAQFTVTVGEDEDTPAVNVYCDTAVRGEQLRVTVELKNGENISNLALKLSYDTSILTLVGTENYGIFKNVSLDSEDSSIIYLSNKNTYYTGSTAFILVFSISGDAPEADTVISVKPIPEKTFDTNNLPIYVCGYECNMSVDAYLYGDVNNDSLIDSTDAELLRNFVAGWQVEINTGAADMNRDGIVNSKDSILLRRLLKV